MQTFPTRCRPLTPRAPCQPSFSRYVPHSGTQLRINTDPNCTHVHRPNLAPPLSYGSFWPVVEHVTAGDWIADVPPLDSAAPSLSVDAQTAAHHSAMFVCIEKDGTQPARRASETCLEAGTTCRSGLFSSSLSDTACRTLLPALSLLHSTLFCRLAYSTRPLIAFTLLELLMTGSVLTHYLCEV